MEVRTCSFSVARAVHVQSDLGEDGARMATIQRYLPPFCHQED